MVLLEWLNQSVRRLQWKLTLSYAAVTLGTLLLTVLILGFLLFSTILAPHELIPPDLWVNVIREQIPSVWRYALSQNPVDTELVSMLLKAGFGEDNGIQVSHFNLARVGDLLFSARMMGEASFLIVDPQGVLLGISNPDWVSEGTVGQPLASDILPGLEVPLSRALAGEVDPDRLFVNIIPYEQFYFAVPIFAEPEDRQGVLGAAVFYIQSIPTESDLARNSANLVVRSGVLFLLAAGVIGIIFGSLTARGMSRRLQHITQVTDAWSQGNFDETLEDTIGDEISRLVTHLNHMAEQLQQLLRKSQEMAALEERNRLARDLHDSAKQEALAASFQIGTALSLIEDNPQKAIEHLHEAENLVDSVRGELADLIHELRPPTLLGDQFIETLEEYCLDWTHQTGIQVLTQFDASNTLPLEVKKAIYRIMQEALANVARHSSAENVEVSFKYSKEFVEFSVRDDGIGFNPQQQSDGIGLDSMQERTASIGGKLTIESKPGEGTSICVTLPFE